jgi:hypothetical protein
MIIEKCKKRKLQTMTQLVAKLRGREVKSVRILKRGPIVNRDNYQVTELIFLVPHLLFKNSAFCLQNNSIFHNVNLLFLIKIKVDSDVKKYIFSLQSIKKSKNKIKSFISYRIANKALNLSECNICYIT